MLFSVCCLVKFPKTPEKQKINKSKWKKKIKFIKPELYECIATTYKYNLARGNRKTPTVAIAIAAASEKQH